MNFDNGVEMQEVVKEEVVESLRACLYERSLKVCIVGGIGNMAQRILSCVAFRGMMLGMVFRMK